MSKIKILNDILQEDEHGYRINVIGFDWCGFPCSEDVVVEKEDIEIVSDRELLIDTTIYYQLCRWLNMKIMKIMKINN